LEVFKFSSTILNKVGILFKTTQNWEKKQEIQMILDLFFKKGKKKRAVSISAVSYMHILWPFLVTYFF